MMHDSSLDRVVAGTDTASDRQLLATAILNDSEQARAFGITPENVAEIVAARSQLLRSFYPAFSGFGDRTLQLPCHQLIAALWHLWLPLAMQLAACRQEQSRPLIQGILGGQGMGKTTLAAILTAILDHLGYRTCSLSIDDLYKTYSDRLILQQQDPRLIWRGPPGTHDIDLGLAVLEQLRQPNLTAPILLPRFDKSACNGAGDRTTPTEVTNIDIVLFEGWFVGVRPIEPSAFENAPPPIITAADRDFARDMNAKLYDYLPLWAYLDRLLVLYPTDYRYSIVWRQQAERKALAAGKAGMTDAQIEEFVKYFWRSLHPDLFIKPLVERSPLVDLVIEIMGDRSFGGVYCPKVLTNLRGAERGV